MKRQAALASMLLISVALIACVTAKQKREEEQELARSIVRTSNAEAVQGCAFIMNLKAVERYGSPETQTASLVIPKPGVEWVILEASGGYQLYSCKTPPSEPQRAAPKPAQATPAAAVASPGPGTAPVAPAPIEAAAPMPSPVPPPSPLAVEAPKTDASGTRVTNNPEAVRGCRFLASFTTYQPVTGFQRAVMEAGGDVGYVVASNRDGEVIGEAYRCASP